MVKNPDIQQEAEEQPEQAAQEPGQVPNLEPEALSMSGENVTDQDIALVSIAVSLKRIADAWMQERNER